MSSVREILAHIDESEVLVITGYRSVRITRGPYSLVVDGQRVGDILPPHGQLEARVDSEMNVAMVLTLIGYRVGDDSTKISCFSRPDSETKLTIIEDGAPTRAIAAALGIDPTNSN